MSLMGSRFSSESAPRPFHHGIRGQGGAIFTAALPSTERQVPSGPANSPHPSSREGHHSTARWSSSFLLLDLIFTAALPSTERQVPSGPANSPHPSSREGHHSTARWSSSFLLLDLISTSFMLLPRLVPGSTGTRCHPPICSA